MNKNLLNLLIVGLLSFTAGIFGCGRRDAVINSAAVFTGPQGLAGADGSNGLNSIIDTINAPVNVCPNEGFIFTSGLDKNGNGVLDTSEVTSSAVICNGAPVSQFTPTQPISPCGPNSSQYKEVLLGLAGGQLLSEFTGNTSNAGSVRNTLLSDGNYSDTDDSACNFSVTTDSSGNRLITWDGSSSNGSGPYNPGQAIYTAYMSTWTINY